MIDDLQNEYAAFSGDLSPMIDDLENEYAAFRRLKSND